MQQVTNITFSPITKVIGFEIPIVSMKPPRFKVDNSATLSFDTGEVNTEQEQAILRHKGSLGTLIYVPENAVGQPPKLDSSYESKKPSERLRSVLYIYWQQQGSPGGFFDSFYHQHMEKIIQAYKDKLDS